MNGVSELSRQGHDEVTVAKSKWTFLTNHGHILVLLAKIPDAKITEIAQTIGITERATLGILRDLEADGYVVKAKVGRRNTYRVDTSRRFRHPAEADHRIAELLRIFTEAS